MLAPKNQVLTKKQKKTAKVITAEQQLQKIATAKKEADASLDIAKNDLAEIQGTIRKADNDAVKAQEATKIADQQKQKTLEELSEKEASLVKIKKKKKELSAGLEKLKKEVTAQEIEYMDQINGMVTDAGVARTAHAAFLQRIKDNQTDLDESIERKRVATVNIKETLEKGIISLKSKEKRLKNNIKSADERLASAKTKESGVKEATKLLEKSLKVLETQKTGLIKQLDDVQKERDLVKGEVELHKRKVTDLKNEAKAKARGILKLVQAKASVDTEKARILKVFEILGVNQSELL